MECYLAYKLFLVTKYTGIKTVQLISRKLMNKWVLYLNIYCIPVYSLLPLLRWCLYISKYSYLWWTYIGFMPIFLLIKLKKFGNWTGKIKCKHGIYEAPIVVVATNSCTNWIMDEDMLFQFGELRRLDGKHSLDIKWRNFR